MSDNTPAYENENLSFEERANDLVSKMTLEEKVSQMLFNAPAIPRLNIPAYNWWNECLHGVARAGTATVFPQAIALASTFDPEFIYHIADTISTEARAKHHEYKKKGDYDIYKGLTYWTPNINIFRDPRWGRGQETYGEDPYLTGRMGVAFVKGLQGDDPKYLKLVATPKHYAVHSGPEADRHSFDAVASKKDLRETYLPAFKECVKEAGAYSIMGAYNRTNGEPCCGSKTLLQDILRDEWGFDGYVVSDCGAISDFHLHHRVTDAAPESAAMAVRSGCDLNCGNMYGNLLIAVREGLINEEAIDTSVTRLMLARFKLGMFDSEERVPYAGIQYGLNDCKKHRELSLEAACKSMVLLKNENLLPLDRSKINSIAVIGPNADNKPALLGNYEGTPSDAITVLRGIREALPDSRVYYSAGCHLYREETGMAEADDFISEAVSAAERSDVVVMCLGLDPTIEGEEMHQLNANGSGDKLDLDFPGRQQQLLEAVNSTGKPVILVIMSGSCIAVDWADKNIPAIIQSWYPGSEGGTAVARLIFGDCSPSGRLPVTFYSQSNTLPDFKDYSMKNRTYRYMKEQPLYPFGYGLSYTGFEYNGLKPDKKTIDAGESLNIKASVKNTGSMKSDEVIQVYLEDLEASCDIPRWQLAGIKRVHLEPGQEQEVSFTITPRQMALIDDEGKCILEPGMFRVYIGGQQPDQRSAELAGKKVLSHDFEVKGVSPISL